MAETNLTIGSTVALLKTELNGLLVDLREQGYQTVGPRARDESIVYAAIDSLDDLPRGLRSEQAPAAYHLIQTGANRFFDFIPGGQSWKQFLFPARHTLFQASKSGKWTLTENDQAAPRYALIGVRSCELEAIHIQDRVFLRSDFYDSIYRTRREGLFILAVNCLQPNATCFCASLGSGPEVKPGYDLCLTELDEVFLVQVGSELGRSLLAKRSFEPASAFQHNSARQAMDRAAAGMGRTLDTSDLPGLLTENLEAEHWTEVGKRCLSCTNCTQVCPTCFCWDASDRVDVLAHNTLRERVWDSCFNPAYSYVFGGNTRPTIRSRYRQWLTHKLGTWKQQFDTFGCVGCGRCITWCPVGIDLTVEVAAIREEVKA